MGDVRETWAAHECVSRAGQRSSGGCDEGIRSAECLHNARAGAGQCADHTKKHCVGWGFPVDSAALVEDDIRELKDGAAAGRSACCRRRVAGSDGQLATKTYQT